MKKNNQRLLNISKVHQNVFQYQLLISIFQIWIKDKIIAFSINLSVVLRRNVPLYLFKYAQIFATHLLIYQLGSSFP